MANTIERRRKVKEDRHRRKIEEDRRKRRQALMRMLKMSDTAVAVNTLSDRNLYKIPYAHIREMSIGDMERMNKKWLKKIKPKKRMTKKEYRRWKNKTKRLGVE